MTGTADHDMVQTVASAAAGDEVAFARIVSAYHGEMHRICVFVCRDATIAEEAVQAAWLIAWRKLGSVRDPVRLRPWLVSIAVNQAKDLLRKRRRRAEIEVVADASAEPGGLDPATGVDSRGSTVVPTTGRSPATSRRRSAHTPSRRPPRAAAIG